MCELKGLDPSYVLTSEERESCQGRLVGGEGRPETQMPATGLGTPASPPPPPNSKPIQGWGFGSPFFMTVTQRHTFRWEIKTRGGSRGATRSRSS